MDDNFMNFWKKLVNTLIKISYMNQKTCVSQANTINRKCHKYWVLHLPMLQTTI